ncbi:MAG: nucleoside transporter C-terminal domain-containing protein [Pseudomonadota bacterium]
MEWGWDNARAFLGIAMIFGIAWGLSENRKAFPWKIVLGAVAIQFAFALILFGIPIIREALFAANIVVDSLIDATAYGTQFVFGPTFGTQAGWEELSGQPGPIFAVHLLPLIIVVAALSAILWHWHILRWVTKGFATIFRRLMGLGGATSLAVSANVFMGMTEAPVLVKPYLKGMTRSEIFILMVAGFATVAGSVLVLYGVFLRDVLPNALGQLLAASLIAAPAAIALALVMVPETIDEKMRAHEPDFEYESTMDAFATGASDGLKILANIVTMLIAAFALLFLVNAFLGWAGAASSFSPYATAKSIDIPVIPGFIEWIFEIIALVVLWVFKILLLPFGILQDVAGDRTLSIELLLGWVFAPIMYMVGVPMSEAAQSGSLIGIKTVLTEFVAFLQLAGEGGEGLSPRTSMITAHAICGFANFGSIGILIGGLSIIEPKRRTTFLELAWKTLVAGTLATCVSGAVVGALPANLFFGS